MASSQANEHDARQVEAPSSLAASEEPRILGALPAPGDEDKQQQTQSLDVSATAADGSDSTTFKFDALGPLVVNSDGTLSRINNWRDMTQAERDRIVRVLGKRNQLRIADLKAQDA
ncbi:hypothetical protein V8E36_008551 [Tilletia maclaganii]